MPLGLFHYQLLHEVLERVHFIHDEDQLGEAILHSVSDALNAEGGTIFRMEKDESIIPVACYGAPLERLKEIPFSKGRGVVGWVVQHMQPVKVDQPARDTRFTGSADAATGFKTRNIIAAPIMVRGEAVGVIEFLNKKEGTFTIPDLELVSMIGREVGIAFENARLIRNQRATQALLSAMTDGLTAGILVVDQKGYVLRINPSGLKILGSRESKTEWEGRPMREKLAEHTDFIRVVNAAISSEAATPRSETRISVDNQERIIGFSGNIVRDTSGERLGTTLLFQDITNLPKRS